MESQLIDRSKPVPLYHQVKDSLRERIDAHEWEPGMKIPTEKELAEEYGVSQITVKQALSRLSMEGLVERYQGRGTFVCQSPLVQDILTLAGFSASFAQAGIEIESRLIGTAVIPASEGISRRLSIDPGESGQARQAYEKRSCMSSNILSSLHALPLDPGPKPRKGIPF